MNDICLFIYFDCTRVCLTRRIVIFGRTMIRTGTTGLQLLEQCEQADALSALGIDRVLHRIQLSIFAAQDLRDAYERSLHACHIGVVAVLIAWSSGSRLHLLEFA